MNDNIPCWRVDLFVETEDVLKGRFTTRALNGYTRDRALYSSVSMEAGRGDLLRATLTMNAPRQDLAFHVGRFYLGQVLDVLSALTHQSYRFKSIPLAGADTALWGKSETIPRARRQLLRGELLRAFGLVVPLRQRHTEFLRAISWYRKGLCEDCLFERFLAYWNCIEYLADDEHARNDPASREVLSQLYDDCLPLLGAGNDGGVKDDAVREGKPLYGARKRINDRMIEATTEEIAGVADALPGVHQDVTSLMDLWFQRIQNEPMELMQTTEEMKGVL
jgi:hypothetical protein